MTKRFEIFSAGTFALSAIIISSVSVHNSLTTEAQILHNPHVEYGNILGESHPTPIAQVNTFGAPDNLDGFGTKEEAPKPTFFRSGKSLDQNIIEEPTEDLLEVFGQEEEVVEPEVVEEVVPEVEEEVLPEVVEEVVPEVEEEEAVQPAAESSLFMQLLKNSKYYIGGAAIFFGVFLFFILRKKKPSAAGMPGNIPAQTVVKPEESSPRLEQALKAMEKEGIAAAGERLKEVKDDSVSFGEPPPVNPEQ
jgi:hypothetical protein